ncbi:protein of unknown function precursor [Polaribacter pacificus]|uniref:Outer membrane insertion C-terminal signal n=1 Tax=Polaribacter pacificus TaxID=1775173 RepID=A0A917HVC9_9FLAO|nr:DUF3078 domain-containing protein [Polaribacter pacificus]GGG92627.1 protein of unknown function precursor [Polaribacter pacificus]
MRNTILAVLCFVSIAVTAQETKDDNKGPWEKSGTFTFLLSQSSFSNWVAGGNNTVSGNVGLNYDFNYQKNGITWDNKLMMQYGINSVKGEESKKTDDMIQFNSLVGKKAKGYWSYSFFLNIKTQFTDGFDYSKTPKLKTSGFFAPAYFSFGPGMLWKKSNNFNFNLAPLTSKITVVSDEFSGQYGTDLGSTTRYELGFNASLFHKTALMENVVMQNIVNVYSNYLDKPGNIDIQYQLMFDMQINKYLSTNLNFHTIVDDNASSKVQFKEVFGLGVNYKF